MKKILASLTTIVLTTGSLANGVLWDNKAQQKTQNNQNVNEKATNEDAEDIASKLWNQSVKIDPNFWLNKDIHSDQKDFNKAIVKDGILTASEVQYVSWGNLNINVAGWYWSKGAFTVSKDGATATGHVTVDADTGETTQQIATKISKATNIKLNYNYWNNKTTQNQLPVLRDILVNDRILTKAEASVVAGVNQTTIKQVGQINLKFNINDKNTNSYANAKVNVVNDGNSAQQIANNMKNVGFGLKTNTVGKYADSSYIMQNFKNLLQDVYGFKAEDLKDISLPHVKLANDNPNINATVTKEGQTATAKVDLECKTSPYIYYHDYSYPGNINDLVFHVNLTPAMTNTLKGIFSHHNAQYDLGVFYNALDDGELRLFSMPPYSGPSYIPWANRLLPNLNNFGHFQEVNLNIIAEATNNLPAIHNFANALYQKIMHSNGYLSIMMHWHYTTGDQNTISDYHFW